MARELYSKGFHVEIYEGVGEFSQRVPANGVLLAHDCPEIDPDELFGLIEAEAGYLPVGMYAASPSAAMIVRAMRRGAVSYLEWPLEAAQIEYALDDLAQRGKHEAALARRNAESCAAVSSLSKREIQVMRELIGGASSKQIGRNLAISPRTVDIHRGNIMSKLKVNTVADLVRIGIYAGIDSSPTGVD